MEVPSVGAVEAATWLRERQARVGKMMDILNGGGLIPEKPLIRLQQQNVVVAGVTFADLLREAMDGAGE